MSGFSRVTSLSLVYISANAFTIGCELIFFDLFLYFIATDPFSSNLFADDSCFISSINGEQENKNSFM